jgi:hypothetical protein
MRILRLIASLFLLMNGVFLTTTPMWGQVDTGLITGTVNDQGGAAIPSATVRISSQFTGVATHITANSQGYFRLAHQGGYLLRRAAAAAVSMARLRLPRTEPAAFFIVFRSPKWLCHMRPASYAGSQQRFRSRRIWNVDVLTA